MKKWYVWIIIIFLVALASWLFFDIQYSNGKKMQNEAQYNESIEAFNKIIWYRDAADQILESKRMKAEEYILWYDFPNALSLYDELIDNNYPNAKSMMEETYIQYGDFLRMSKKFDEAIIAYERSKRDVSQIVKEVRKEKNYYSIYTQAITYLNASNISACQKELDKLPDDYNNIAALKSDLATIKNNPFIGLWSAKIKNPYSSSHYDTYISIGWEYDNFGNRIRITWSKKMYLEGSLLVSDSGTSSLPQDEYLNIGTRKLHIKNGQLEENDRGEINHYKKIVAK